MKNIPKCSPFTVRKTFLFLGKFQIHCFSWFRRTVVSSEKMIQFQSVSSAAWAQSRRFSGFDIGRLNLAPYSFNCLLTDVYILSFEDTLYGAVARSLIRCATRSSPIHFESLRFLDCFHLLSQYCTVLFVHFIAFAIAFTPSCAPIGCSSVKLES